mmetsp:Transcript_504/g.555  ORF Transcript_504/g.555 Transcript_504/m.555 type:complete len:107 (-) Transcript_504:56-376(-)
MFPLIKETIYCATKNLFSTLGYSICTEIQGGSIDLLTVNPGFVKTNMIKNVSMGVSTETAKSCSSGILSKCQSQRTSGGNIHDVSEFVETALTEVVPEYLQIILAG